MKITGKTIIITIFILFLISCKKEESAPSEVTDEKTDSTVCLTYTVPDDMEEAPDVAYKYRFDNLLVEKGKSFYNSEIIIIIKSDNNINKLPLNDFVENDQKHLKNQIEILNENEWFPDNLKIRSFDFYSFEFSYIIQGQTIYQRSLYIKCEEKVYIISLNSKEEFFMLNEENNAFWESITVD